MLRPGDNPYTPVEIDSQRLRLRFGDAEECSSASQPMGTLEFSLRCTPQIFIAGVGICITKQYRHITPEVAGQDVMIDP